MLRRLAELHYTTPTLYHPPYFHFFQSHDTGYTFLRNQVWCFMSFPLLSHVFCFVLMQNIANVYSPSTYGSMRVLLHLYEKIECPIVKAAHQKRLDSRIWAM
jgi:hypothetical protein